MIDVACRRNVRAQIGAGEFRPRSRRCLAVIGLALLAATLAARPARAATPADCDERKVAKAIVSLFGGDDAGERVAAAQALSRCRAKGAAGALARVARSDDDPAVRRAVIESLAAIGARPALEAIVKDARTAPDDRARAEALLNPVTAPLPPERPPPVIHPEEIPEPTPSLALPPVSATGPGAPESETPRADEVETPRPIEPLGLPAAPGPVTPTGEAAEGLPLAVATSAAAGGALFPLLSLMSGLDSPGTLILTGSAGAVIGAGTTWGLSRFGYRPTVPEAAWYATASTWGALVGTLISKQAAFNEPRLRYGSIALSEVVGVGVGAWSASAFEWTGPEVVLANSLVAGGGLIGLGVERLRPPEGSASAAAAYAVVPWMVGSAAAAHLIEPTSNDLHLMFVSAAAAGWTGGLVASGLDETPLATGRRGQGGLALGTGAGYLLATGAAAFTEVDPSRTWGAGLALGAGNLVGRGLEKWIRPTEPERWNLGTGLGGAAFGLGTFIYYPYARFGPSAPSMTLTGLVTAPLVAYGAFRAGHEPAAGGTPEAALRDGSIQSATILAGTAGLITSRFFHPDVADEATAVAFAGLGMSAGLGAARLTFAERGAADSAGAWLGAAAGFTSGAIFTHNARLRAPEVGAGFVGAAYGASGGALVLTLREPTWHGGRRDQAGAALGLTAGAVAGGVLAAALDADGGEVAVPMFAGVFGAGIGGGVGLMASRPGDSRPLRVGALAGTGALMTTSMLLEPALRLGDGLGPAAGSLFAEGALTGAAWGALAGGLFDRPAGDSVERLAGGGALAGASAGAATGLVLSKFFEPKPQSYGFTLLTGTLGGLGGWGASMLATDAEGRADPAAALGGSALSFVGSAVASHYLTLEAPDWDAGLVGAPFGGLLGGLSASLSGPASGASTRAVRGGALLGASAGALGAIALRQATGGEARDVGLTALGGLDGVAAGLGIGMALDRSGTRDERAGSLVGAAAGLGLGAGVWSRLTLGPGDVALIGGAGAFGAWTGAWLPVLGDAAWGDVSGQQVAGGLLAGGALGVAAASALAPALELDDDLVSNALAMDTVFSVAGAGAASLLSERADHAAAAVLGAGTGGLLLGGALHRQIDIDGDDGPWLTLATAQGAWVGGWLPRAIYPSASLNARREGGGVAAGMMGMLGLATLSSSVVALDTRQLGLGLTGSALGSAFAGGVTLLSKEIGRQSGASLGASLIIGASTLGAVGGAALAPYVDFEGRAFSYGALGATLGASEASLFAWASQGATADDYRGAILIGGGVGTTLGLTAAAHPFLTAPTALASSGFGAWGAWIGSFAAAAADPRAPRVSGAGTLGADAGFLVGFSLLRLDVIEPRDFGWLSLGGALGTVGGGLAGALLTRPSDRAPLWAGLAIGPLAGMAAGGIALPKLRSLNASPPTARGPSSEPASAATASSSAPSASTADPAPSGTGFRRRLEEVVSVASCTPFFGALPAPAEAGAPSPVLLGVTGRWR
jgi:hypothetical protein